MKKLKNPTPCPPKVWICQVVQHSLVLRQTMKPKTQLFWIIERNLLLKQLQMLQLSNAWFTSSATLVLEEEDIFVISNAKILQVTLFVKKKWMGYLISTISDYNSCIQESNIILFLFQATVFLRSWLSYLVFHHFQNIPFGFVLSSLMKTPCSQAN